MGKQVIPDGIYRLMGPGGQLTAMDGRIAIMQPNWGPEPLQRWETVFDKGSYTLRNAATGAFVGAMDPDEPDWMLRGTRQPFPWTLTDGDGDPSSFTVTSTASTDGLRLSPSILKIFPPPAALAPPSPVFDYEWSFQPV